MLYIEKEDTRCLSPHPNLSYDESCLDIFNFLNRSVAIQGQYTECDKCLLRNFTTLNDSVVHKALVLNSPYPIRLQYEINSSFTCRLENLFYEHYRYVWNITEECEHIYPKESAEDAYLPILSAFIILFFFGTIWYTVKCVYRCTKNSAIFGRLMFWRNEMIDDLGNTDDSSLIIESRPKIKKHPDRIKAVDIFRGFCIMLMIFVNYGGGKYWFFRHSIWNGLTVADLVFPWFVWLMGFSLSISLKKKLRHVVPRRQLIFSTIRRSCLLIFLGFMLNTHGKTENLDSIRYPGVLQRLGLTYLVVGIIEASLAKRTATMNENPFLAIIQDLLDSAIQWVIMFVMLAIHLVITFELDVPGCGKGYLGPGGLQGEGKHENCTGGAAGYIDRQIFGDHLYSHPTCMKMYKTHMDYDPEGLLGSFTCIFLAYMGVQAGRILNTFTSVKAKCVRWISWGFIFCLIGGALCKFSKNDGLIPINKNLWSASFIFVLGGTAFIIHTILFVLVDITRKWGGRPFFYPGMNSIVLFVGHELFRNTFPFAWAPIHRTHGNYLAMNLWGTALWVVISITMYKKNIFVKL